LEDGFWPGLEDGLWLGLEDGLWLGLEDGLWLGLEDGFWLGLDDAFWFVRWSLTLFGKVASDLAWKMASGWACSDFVWEGGF